MGWLKSRRRRRLLESPFPSEWHDILFRRVRHYRHLPSAQMERVDAITRVLVAEKEWAGAVGFEVTDEMRVTIAGMAGVMVSGYNPPYFFDRLHTFVLHGKAVRFSPEQAALNPSLPDPWPLDGVAWNRGPVLLVWAAIRDERRGPERGRNVVFHELAHHLDGLDGHMDGIPPLSASAVRHWKTIVDVELAQLEADARQGVETILDHGGAESEAEFFAVATESFFEHPHALRREHRELYDALTEFYEQDPADWLPRWE